MPKDFSEDGASTYTGSVPTTPGTAGSGGAAQFDAANGITNPLYLGAAGANPFNVASRAGDTSSGVDYTSEASIKASPGVKTYAAGDMSNPEYYMFDDGGSVPDAGSGGAGGGDDLISLALASVDSALKHGRQKYGLGGDNDNSGGQMQTAGNMPVAPSSQSESGIRPLEPGPGTLAPAANPFGRRQVPPPKMSQGAIPDDDSDQEAA